MLIVDNMYKCQLPSWVEKTVEIAKKIKDKIQKIPLDNIVAVKHFYQINNKIKS